MTLYVSEALHEVGGLSKTIGASYTENQGKMTEHA